MADGVTVKVHPDHVKLLTAIAKAKGTDLAGAFAHAVTLAHFVHVDGDPEAESAGSLERMDEVAEKLGKDDPKAKGPAMKALAAVEKGEGTEGTSTKNATRPSPLAVGPNAKRWASR
jgi:hypothetical protein